MLIYIVYNPHSGIVNQNYYIYIAIVFLEKELKEKEKYA